MFARANKTYESKAPARGSQLAKQPFPSSSPSAPKANIRDQLQKPSVASTSARTVEPSSNFQNRSMNMSQSSCNRLPTASGRLASLCAPSSSIKKDSMVIDLTEPGARAKVHEAVFFAEDDFSDDDMLDLDYEAPSALPTLPSAAASKPVSFDGVPKSTQSEAIPWSSSPASHLLPPTKQRIIPVQTIVEESCLKRESSGDQDSFEHPVQKKVKRRVLPVSFRQEEPEEDEEDSKHAMQTPVSKPNFNPWDATTSAVKEQKKQLKNQRQQKEALQENTKEEQDDAQEDGPSLADIPNVGKSLTKKSFAFSLSDEQKHVLDLVVNKGSSVFFTGPAGTGKSVLMRAIITALKEKYARDPERVAVTASTGLAACNIGGITLHSFSGIGLGKEDAPTLVKKIRRNPKAKNRWLKTGCLVVDEISMVDGDLFDKLDKIGRTIRQNGRPWGGIQVIITGDFFQLPPVPDSSKRETKFAFDAATWSTSIDHTIGLTQVFRQRDPKFATMLNEMRLGKISEDTVRAFKALSRPLNFNDGLGMAELFSTRAEVEGSNERRLNDLKGRAKRFDAQDSGEPAIREKLLANMMAPKSIVLKVGAQVMLIKNLDESLVNGSLGKVIAFSDEKSFDMGSGDSHDFDEDPTSKARRKLKAFSHDADVRPKRSGTKYPVVQFMTSHGTQRVILCVPEDWKVELPNGEVQAKRTQLPLILAWALSIHKAQGQTLERVKVNLGRVFEKGQAYVALSRATTQDGLQVMGFDKMKVMAHPRVVSFYNQLYSAEDALKKKPGSINDFLTNRIGPVAPKTEPKKEIIKRETPTVLDLDDDEEAMASYGY
ncbi:ATP-dependent DNA helicase PIF1 [Neonectria ditissima]|uniref:ATP-dependent DNA helicase PIF1 n=1 Tax=Neonectria ditissima TaxID=78410 RepID=A0A0P7BBB4_9HYPO|nr:ATP-dependent DNA helicase PIF1 [Neonectria ditissima]